ncbi:hypothetical protein Tco_1369682 [Tanacetum coccineum]
MMFGTWQLEFQCGSLNVQWNEAHPCSINKEGNQLVNVEVLPSQYSNGLKDCWRNDIEAAKGSSFLLDLHAAPTGKDNKDKRKQKRSKTDKKRKRQDKSEE